MQNGPKLLRTMCRVLVKVTVLALGRIGDRAIRAIPGHLVSDADRRGLVSAPSGRLTSHALFAEFRSRALHRISTALQSLRASELAVGANPRKTSF